MDQGGSGLRRRLTTLAVGAALGIAGRTVDEMREHVAKAKQSRNIDAAVNLAATTKRLLSLVEEGERIR